jgi:hypothetical protein
MGLDVTIALNHTENDSFVVVGIALGFKLFLFIRVLPRFYGHFKEAL